MATSEQLRSDRRGRMTVRPVESVPPTATVRHVDQLEADALEAFLELVSGNRSRDVDETTLEPGEVVVFTEYYRLERP
ncbi:hypothetical protein [Salinadaptatus halalkaliphilus]|nr:hypothetical protein [Salinadaptatus halalkaliphilus]